MQILCRIITKFEERLFVKKKTFKRLSAILRNFNFKIYILKSTPLLKVIIFFSVFKSPYNARYSKNSQRNPGFTCACSKVLDIRSHDSTNPEIIIHVHHLDETCFWEIKKSIFTFIQYPPTNYLTLEIIC